MRELIFDHCLREKMGGIKIKNKNILGNSVTLLFFEMEKGSVEKREFLISQCMCAHNPL